MKTTVPLIALSLSLTLYSQAQTSPDSAPSILTPPTEPAQQPSPQIYDFAHVDTKPTVAKAYSIRAVSTAKQVTPATIVCTLTISPSGQLLNYSVPVDTLDEIKKNIRESLTSWQFTPALHKGIPVICRYRQTLALRPPNKTDSTANTDTTTADLPPPAETQPLRINYITPRYPIKLIDSGEIGRVRCELEIDTKGRVDKVTIIEESHKEFGRSAKATLKGWAYIPARKNGELVEARLQETIEFSPPPAAARPKEILIGSKLKAAITALGTIYEAAQLDEMPKRLKSISPEYPYLLKDKGISGDALCEVILSSTGEPLSVKILKASKKEFGLAAQDALFRSAFQAGKKDGQAVPCRIEIPINFSTSK